MKFFDHLDTAVRIVAGLCLFAVFVLVTAQVASRFLFNFSLAAASELSIYAMIWSVFLGAAVAFRSNSHIAMDILKNKLPKSVQGVADVVIFILLAGFLCLIATEGYDLALRAMRQSSPAAKIPVGYITMAIPVGSILALIFLTEQKLRPFFKDKRHD
ncbi:MULTISPECIES: TRAP transporter small permease [Pacificibacter]|uniref:TRAP transporter small permease n=1 Tax=Pacificibacter TaxID=1042323 RepID=UPI001C0A07A9|nr:MULTISPECIES: TRAP transporter small permease [Pacificibacter]MBU2936415.1 TRAP transporter small permease [Pacificibacter marinus]MDO6616544.1 TRAP transporter small permease [Pacificibacter sp. 1_MG-2023]